MKAITILTKIYYKTLPKIVKINICAIKKDLTSLKNIDIFKLDCSTRSYLKDYYHE